MSAKKNKKCKIPKKKLNKSAIYKKIKKYSMKKKSNEI